MPILAHLILGKVLEVAVASAAAFAYIALFGIPKVTTLSILPLALCLIAALLVTRLLFRGATTANCPKCGGRARCRGVMPIRFECRECGHTHWTRVYEAYITLNGHIWEPPWVDRS